MANYCDTTGTILTSTMGPSYTDLRHRIGWVDAGNAAKGTHTGTQNVRIKTGFYSDCEKWANTIDSVFDSCGKGRLDWIGEVGVLGHCETSAFSWHHTARAFDISRINSTTGWYVDTNWSWRQSALHIRAYLAMVALTRFWFKNTLTAWYNTDHYNHIHFDNGVALTPFNKARADTVIIQAACKYIDGASIPIDGVYGDSTRTALINLRNKIAPNAANMFSDLEHTRLFLLAVALHGVSNTPV